MGLDPPFSTSLPWAKLGPYSSLPVGGPHLGPFPQLNAREQSVRAVRSVRAIQNAPFCPQSPFLPSFALTPAVHRAFGRSLPFDPPLASQMAGERPLAPTSNFMGYRPGCPEN